MKRKKVDMTRDIFNQTLKLLDRDNYWEEFDRFSVELHQIGEPLILGDKLFYFLNRLKEENIPWSMSTNGILLTNEYFNKKLLSYYEGVLEISVENINPKITIEQKYDIINNFLDQHKKYNSKLIIILISYGNVDYSKLIGKYSESYYDLHTWGEDGEDGIQKCKYLADNYFSVHSDGNIVSCCFDAENETNYGNVFNPKFELNKVWRKCKTCIG